MGSRNKLRRGQRLPSLPPNSPPGAFSAWLHDPPLSGGQKVLTFRDAKGRVVKGSRVSLGTRLPKLGEGPGFHFTTAVRRGLRAYWHAMIRARENERIVELRAEVYADLPEQQVPMIRVLPSKGEEVPLPPDAPPGATRARRYVFAMPDGLHERIVYMKRGGRWMSSPPGSQPMLRPATLDEILRWAALAARREAHEIGELYSPAVYRAYARDDQTTLPIDEWVAERKEKGEPYEWFSPYDRELMDLAQTGQLRAENEALKRRIAVLEAASLRVSERVHTVRDEALPEGISTPANPTEDDYADLL